MLHSKVLNLAKYTNIQDVEMRAFNSTDALSASNDAMEWLKKREQAINATNKEEGIPQNYLVIIDTQYNSHQYSHTILVTYGWAAELDNTD